MSQTHRSAAAFSLVELSIVLVILGLLTGGILAGQSLIRAAELRAVAAEYTRYRAAAQTFRDKYFAIPGDMTNATAFWGIAAGTGSDNTCKVFSSTTPATCNGDGDGRVANSTGSYESARFWQHMANAGLIEGQFSGQFTTPLQPVSKLSNGSWYIISLGNYAGNTSTFAGDYGNNLQILSSASDVILKPEEAWNIDRKFDDGLPGTGLVIGYKGTAAHPCTTMANTAVGADLNAAYNLTDTAIDCILYFTKTI